MHRLWVFCLALTMAVSGCQSPYKKKDQEDQKPMKDQSGDTSFQSFLGLLRTAVAKRDRVTLTRLMAPDFGYRWDSAPAGETAFDYWDKNNLWGELTRLLNEPFAPKGEFMVAPAQFASPDSVYNDYRVGLRPVVGSWKFVYFVPGEPAPIE